ncbi:LNS2 domain-containing protein [Enterococcus sp. DIV0170]|uniref:LNS2 domain-containing protein n=1 Tax=Enterococcus sp. DIV0170 TaxID=2774642 RepID=UPI003F254BCD
MKAIVMDIDNTFCEKRGSKEYKDLEPYPEVVEQMRSYHEKGYKIVLQTARQMNTHQGNLGLINKITVPILIEWLEKWEIPYDELHVGKPWCGHGGFYVDDRAIRPKEFVTLTEEEILKRIEDDTWKQ